VNNAGLLLEGRFGAIGLDEQLRLLQVNIVALTALTRLFLGPMLERNCGRVLNVASVAAFMPVPNLAVYAASKAYVLSFGDALFQELSGTKITVTTLCPGVTDTGMVHGTSLGGLTRHDDHGRKDGCSRRVSRLYGGKAGPCRGNCKRACSPMDQVSA
jgi:short-subunit dehydrogenase